MSKIKEGADSFLLLALTEALVSEKAIPTNKVGAVSKRFQERVNENDLAKKYPAEVLAHVGKILGRLAVLGQEPVLDFQKEVPATELAFTYDQKTKDGYAYVYNVSGVNSEGLPSSNADGYPSGLRAAAKAMEKMGIPVPPAPKVDLTLDPADINLLLEDTDVSECPSARSALQAALDGVADRFAASPRHPFIETLKHDGVSYIVVGTATIRSSKKTNVSRSANATVKNYRRIKDADESVLVHIDGRPMCATRELENGVCFVWLLHHVQGLVVRFWLNEVDGGLRKDNPKGSYRIIIGDPADKVGWSKAS